VRAASATGQAARSLDGALEDELEGGRATYQHRSFALQTCWRWSGSVLLLCVV